MATKQLPPSLEEMEVFLKDLADSNNPRGHEWYREPELADKEPWQREAMRHISDNSHAIMQGPRQWFGKTWTTSRYAAACLCRGLNTLVSYPTQGQGEQLMIDRVDQAMLKMENKGIVRRKKPDNVRFKKWDTAYGEVQLKVLSLSEGAKSGTQGFTADVWICDEAQECILSTYEAVEPSIDIADKEGRSKIILCGVGGNSTEHLIEAKKPLEDKDWRDKDDPVDEDEAETPFISRRFTTEHIVACSPSFGPWYERKRRNMTPQAWRQNYECLPCMEGLDYVFPKLERWVEPFSTHMPVRYEFGIDVGRVNNVTAVGCFEVRGEVANLIDQMQTGGEFNQQAKEIASWLSKWDFLPGNVRIEVNGLGWGLFDSLRLCYTDSGIPLAGISPVTTLDNEESDYLKTRNILWLQAEAMGYDIDPARHRPRLGVLNGVVRGHLRRLMCEKKNTRNGVQYEWPHSDWLSMMFVWAHGKMGAFAV